MPILAAVRRTIARLQGNTTGEALAPYGNWASGCATPGLEAGSVGRRLATWQPVQQHVNTLLQGAGENVLSRARWLVRNNGYARAAVEAWTAATVGPGIKPNSLVEDEDLRETINAAWLRWTDECDVEDVTDFYGLTRRVAREAFLAGEVFVRFRPRFRQDGLFVPLQLQMLPSEQLASDQAQDTYQDRPIRMGIEFDPNVHDRRIGYWFWRANPTDQSLTFQDALRAMELTRVPAEDIIHIYDPIEAGQIRGLSAMAAAMVRLFMLDMYDDAEVERKRQIARYATFIKRPDFRDGDGMPFGVPMEGHGQPMDGAWGGLEPRPEGEIQQGDYYGPGATVVLYPGEEVQFSQPGEVGNSYEPFQYRTLLQICAALGIPYTELSHDLNRTTYASSRAGLLAFRARVEAFQHGILVYQLLRKTWNRWMDMAVLAGALPINAEAYLRDPQRYRVMEAITPKAPWVDPLKDRQAVVLALRSGMMSPRQAAAAEGYDIEDVYRQIAEDRELAEELGIDDRIDYGWSARATQQQQQAPQRPAAPPQRGAA